MAIQREDLVRIVRAAVAGESRTLNDGSFERRLPAVYDPATFEPPEWVIEAMRSAYSLGLNDGNRSGSGLYPEGA